jgi:hypothetical protein
MTAPAPLRSPGPPTRVGDLLLPTLLTLAGRNTLSAQYFLSLLRGASEPPVTGRHPVAVTAGVPTPRKEVNA